MLKFSFKFFVGYVICLYGISQSLTRPPTPTITSASYSDGKITIEGNLSPGAEQYHAVLLTDLSASLTNAYESVSSLRPFEGAAVSSSANKFPIVISLENQTIERYFVAVSASKIDSNRVRIFSGWRVYTDSSGLPISISTSQADKKETVFYRARKISERNDSLVVIDFKFSLPTPSASAYSFKLKRDSTEIVSFSDLSSITDTVNNITSALTYSSRINNNTLVIMRESNGFYLYNIYTILSDYGKNASDRLSGQLIKTITGEVDTAIAHIGIYGDIPHQNMISTVYDLLRDTASSNPLYPGTLQSITPSDTLKAKLLITAMLDLSVPHNSPAPNSNEAAGGIFTNYIQCMDNIVRNWTTIRSGGIGLPRLRNIHANILATNKDSVIIDPIYVKNHGTLAEYGQQKEAQKRKNYAFYEGYSRLNIDLAVRPSGSPAVPTTAGLMFRISPNIQLYQANLADTFNMFDTAFISGGPLSRRIIIPSNDSLLLKFQTDGIWLKGDSANSSEKNYYCGMEAVRLKMQSGVDSIGVPFAAGSEGAVLGDVVGSIVGDGEKSILKLYDLYNDGDKIDTICNDKFANMYLHGQSKILEVDSNFLENSAVDFFTITSDSNVHKVLINRQTKYRAVFQDTSTFSDYALAAWHYFGNKPAAVFYYKVASKKILLKNAKDGILKTRGQCDPQVQILIEMSEKSWFDKDLREDGMFYFYKSSADLRLFKTKECRVSELLWPDKSNISSENGKYYDWVSFHTDILMNPMLYFVYKPGPEKKWFRIDYVNKEDKRLVKSEKFIFLADKDYSEQLNALNQQISSLCDCKRDSPTAYNECMSEACVIAKIYMTIWGQNANSEESYGYGKGARSMDNPNERVHSLNVGDIHSGWYCYQWAYFLYSALFGNDFKQFTIQRSGFLSSDGAGNEGENMLHNWVTIFVCGSTMSRSTTGGLHLDPWINNRPFAHTPARHEELLGDSRNFVSTDEPIKDGYKGFYINNTGMLIKKVKHNFEW